MKTIALSRGKAVSITEAALPDRRLTRTIVAECFCGEGFSQGHQVRVSQSSPRFHGRYCKLVRELKPLDALHRVLPAVLGIGDSVRRGGKAKNTGPPFGCTILAVNC